MSPELATLSDVQAIALRASRYSQKYLLGITVDTPRYEKFPDDSDPNGVYEFLVNCWILEGPSQAVTIGSSSSGLRVIEDILVASEATGDLLADINVPVEIRKNHSSGQLEVIGRTKVALPALRLDEYDVVQLGIHHILELEYGPEDGLWRDAFGIVCNLREGTVGDVTGPNISWQTSTSSALSNLLQLAYDDSNVAVGLGGGLFSPPRTNPFQRVIVTTTSAVEAVQLEDISVSEISTVTLN